MCEGEREREGGGEREEFGREMFEESTWARARAQTLLASEGSWNCNEYEVLCTTSQIFAT